MGLWLGTMQDSLQTTHKYFMHVICKDTNYSLDFSFLTNGTRRILTWRFLEVLKSFTVTFTHWWLLNTDANHQRQWGVHSLAHGHFDTWGGTTAACGAARRTHQDAHKKYVLITWTAIHSPQDWGVEKNKNLPVLLLPYFILTYPDAVLSLEERVEHKFLNILLVFGVPPGLLPDTCTNSYSWEIYIWCKSGESSLQTRWRLKKSLAGWKSRTGTPPSIFPPPSAHTTNFGSKILSSTQLSS